MKNESLYNELKKHNCCIIISADDENFSVQQIEKCLNFSEQIILYSFKNKIPEQISSEIIIYNSNSKNTFKHVLKFAENKGFKFAFLPIYKSEPVCSIIPEFIHQITFNEHQIVLGSNALNKNTGFVEKLSRLRFQILTGITNINPKACLHIYPLNAINKLNYFTRGKYLNTELLVMNAWRGVSIKSVSLKEIYIGKECTSKPAEKLKSFFFFTILYFILFILSFFYGIPSRLIHLIRKRSLKTIIKNNILQTKDSNIKISKAVGFGFFMGIVPIWGWQTIVGISLSHYLKLNKAIVVLASNISFTPVLPLLLFASYYTGAMLIGNELSWSQYTGDLDIKTVTKDLFQYLIGSFVFAVITGMLTFGITYLFLRIFRKNKTLSQAFVL
jgi:uncharacterized protein (DUF2062 family)